MQLVHTKIQIMKSLKYVLLISVLMGGFAVIGCKEKGPMEKTGEKIDDAAKKTGDALEDAGDKAKDAVDQLMAPSNTGGDCVQKRKSERIPVPAFLRLILTSVCVSNYFESPF